MEEEIFDNNFDDASIACIHCNPERLKKAIEYGANVNNTLLHLACRTSSSGALEVVKILVEAKANINAEDKDGNTPLRIACTRNVDVSKFLIEKGADVNKGNLIFLVYKYGDREFAKFLVTKVANVNKRYLLSEACCNGDTEFVKFLIKNGIDVNTGRVIEYVQNLEILKLLVENGGDIHVKNEALDKRTEMTLLHYKQSAKKVKYLISLGLDPNARNSIGETPLHIAVRYGLLELVKFYLEIGIDINALTTENENVLHYLNKRAYLHVDNKVEIMKLLLQKVESV